MGARGVRWATLKAHGDRPKQRSAGNLVVELDLSVAASGVWVFGAYGVWASRPVAPAAAGERVEVVVLGLVHAGHDPDVLEVVGIDSQGGSLLFRLPSSMWTHSGSVSVGSKSVDGTQGGYRAVGTVQTSRCSPAALLKVTAERSR
ncbi:MAG TPA: hypothetical protein VJN19_09965 [Propionibacteriaceae bacterium]|nr:hypothetical protein [Propionibacteriaceae bacterium]